MSLLEKLDMQKISYIIRDGKILVELSGLKYEIPISDTDLKNYLKNKNKNKII